jgi:hypothetical protein
MKLNAHPLTAAEIAPAPELYRVDVSEHTREILRKRSERALPTMRTTRGDSRWTWGRPTEGPSNSGAPKIFSPSDLEQRRPKP